MNYYYRRQLNITVINFTSLPPCNSRFCFIIEFKLGAVDLCLNLYVEREFIDGSYAKAHEHSAGAASKQERGNADVD